MGIEALEDGRTDEWEWSVVVVDVRMEEVVR